MPSVARRLRQALYALSPIAGFAVYLKVSVVAAIILVSPWVLYQLWRFLESGLYPMERRAVLLLAPFSAVMTAIGMVFLYYIMLPVCLWFLISFTSNFPMADLSHSNIVLGALEGRSESTVEHPSTHNTSMAIPIFDRKPSDLVEGQMWVDRSRSELRIHLNGQIRSVSLRSSTLISRSSKSDNTSISQLF